MKYVKFYALGAFVSLAFITANFTVATPTPTPTSVAVQPATLYLYHASVFFPSEDDDREEPNDGSDQCRLAFPYCEAHVV